MNVRAGLSGIPGGGQRGVFLRLGRVQFDVERPWCWWNETWWGNQVTFTLCGLSLTIRKGDS
jgi:hypothetical protein